MSDKPILFGFPFGIPLPVKLTDEMKVHTENNHDL